MRESAVETRLVDAVKAAGGMTVKLTTRAHLPDRLVILPGGRVLFVELKRPGERPRFGQRIMHRRLRALGVEVHVVDHPDAIVRLINAKQS